MNNKITLVECPRDAMQGWSAPISTVVKVSYIQQLLSVGFDVLDCVSFVSPKAIPQMADSAAVLQQLDLSDTSTKLLAIVANTRGAEMAREFDSLYYIGYPFSISETFQQFNTNSSIGESWERLQQIQEITVSAGKQMVVYFSMGFGNPYGDLFDADVIAEWAEKMQNIGIGTISLADTAGVASPESVRSITADTIRNFPGLEVGVHLHSTTDGLPDKLDAALDAGCLRIDGAMKGVGGCPMAQNALVGNMDTESIVGMLKSRLYSLHIDPDALQKASFMATQIFNDTPHAIQA